ncbi:MAG: hypothetical protein Q8L48_34750 [Archangium sp.]|nr:hypothetical protein [Archangium sp.]
MNSIKLALCVALLSFAGCKKEAATTGAPPGTGRPGEANTPPPTTDKPGPAETAKNPAGCNSDFAEALVADATLTEKCSPYDVKSELNIDGLALTIEPGVVLNFADTAGFSIGFYKPARVLVKGTKEKPVKFTGRSWRGIKLQPQAAGSSFEHLIVENAGTEDAAAFTTETFDVSLDTVAFTGAKKTVLDLKVDRPLKGLTALDLSKASADPSELIHTTVATAGVFGPGSQYPAGAIIWLHEALEGDITLSNPGATYRVPQVLGIDAPEGKTASLTIKEGVTLELGENASLNFGFYRGPAGLKIQGTKEKPVTITRFGEDKAQTPSGGVQLLAGARAPEIDFLVLEYAGGPDKGALSMTDTRGLGKITNSTFRHLKGEAIHVESSAERFVAFDNNTFEDVDDAALRLPLELAHGLGANNRFTDKARVSLFGETKKDTTLENIGAPYLVEGTLNVNGDDTKAATLTIAAGNTLLFNDQGKLSVSFYAPGKLVAKGTPEKPIVLGKLLTSWGGVGINGKGAVELENVTISGTSDDDFPLDLTDEVTGTVKNVSLKDTKKGLHNCAKKVKPAGVTADKGIKAVEKC